MAAKETKNNNTVNDLSFENIQLIKVAGMALLGIVKKNENGSFSIDGIECKGLPGKSEFTDLFKAVVTDKCISTTVDQANDVVTLAMKGPQRIAFAGSYAEFKEAMSMAETTLLGMALDKLV